MVGALNNVAKKSYCNRFYYMFDSHAHVAFEQFDNDRRRVVKRAYEAGVNSWIEVGSDVNNSRRAVGLANKIEGVYAAVGVHPDNITGLNSGKWTEIRVLLEEDKVKAVGEVGLDYYRGGSFEEQASVLSDFIKVANDFNLPMIFHVRSGEDRDAHEDLLSLLNSLGGRGTPRGVIHMFGGSLEQAKKYVDSGMYLGISGIVTFKNAGSLVEVAREIPLENILVETDCPYVAPEPHRGERNEPAYVKLVVEKVAEIKGSDVAVVERVTEKNACDLFNLEA